MPQASSYDYNQATVLQDDHSGEEYLSAFSDSQFYDIADEEDYRCGNEEQTFENLAYYKTAVDPFSEALIVQSNNNR